MPTQQQPIAVNATPRALSIRGFKGIDLRFNQQTDVFANTDYDETRTDSQGPVFAIQNNVDVDEINGLSTRRKERLIASAPAGAEFTGVAFLDSDLLYAATADGSIYYKSLVGLDWTKLAILDEEGNAATGVDFTTIGRVDTKLVCLGDNKLWSGEVGTDTIQHWPTLTAPAAFTLDNFAAVGDLKIGGAESDETPYRVTLSSTYVNEYGPTETGDRFVLYASLPPTSWTASGCLKLSGTTPTDAGILATEIYWQDGDNQEPAFLCRVDFTDPGEPWEYTWIGYLDDISNWLIANLTAPTENYTSGVNAKYYTQIDGKVYFWGGDEVDRVYIGGGSENPLCVARSAGGGFVDIEQGLGYEVKSVLKYKTVSGQSIVTIMCDSDNSHMESRFNLLTDSLQISTTNTFTSYEAERVENAVGCKSRYGAVAWGDGLYSVSRYGIALTTMVAEYNSQIKVEYVSGQISPMFRNVIAEDLRGSYLLQVGEVLYLTLVCERAKGVTQNSTVFCYDTTNKCWWTYTADTTAILSLMHIDYDKSTEGVGVISRDKITLLPTTGLNDQKVDYRIESNEIGTQQGRAAIFRVTSLDLFFDWFEGEMKVYIDVRDRFGREVTTYKTIKRETTAYNVCEPIRLDLDVASFRLRFVGEARFRMTQVLAKVYAKSIGIGMERGFDAGQGTELTRIRDTYNSFIDYQNAIGG